MEPEIFSSTLFTEVRRVRSFDGVADQIREAIASGVIPPSTRLPNERQLAQAFGVSRTTLREAMRTLEATGVLEIRQGKSGGIFVATPDISQVASALETMFRFRGATANELAEFRTTFEGENAYWATIRATEEDVALLRSISSRFSDLASDLDTPWSVLSELDIEFHQAVAKVSKNQVRIAIMFGINGAFNRVSISLEDVVTEAVRSEISTEICAIAQAITCGDSDIARKLMLEHVAKFSEMEMTVSASTVATVQPIT